MSTPFVFPNGSFAMYINACCQCFTLSPKVFMPTKLDDLLHFKSDLLYYSRVNEGDFGVTLFKVCSFDLYAILQCFCQMMRICLYVIKPWFLMDGYHQWSILKSSTPVTRHRDGLFFRGEGGTSQNMLCEVSISHSIKLPSITRYKYKIEKLPLHYYVEMLQYDMTP